MSLLRYYCTLTEYSMDKYDLGNNKETKQLVLNFFLNQWFQRFYTGLNSQSLPLQQDTNRQSIKPGLIH